MSQASPYTSGMTLEQIVQTIAAELKPEKIILFGSHARGEAKADSDYDLFVIVPYEGDRHILGVQARSSVRDAGVPIDVIVYPKAQLQAFLDDDGSDFLDNVFDEGIVVYETPLPQAA
jgi:predicted nucleotidyltransferase